MSPAVVTSSPKSLLAYHSVRSWIDEGRFAVGERLPSEREMAKELGMNHLTLRRGLSRLEDEGVIVKKPQVGSFVAQGEGVVRLALVLPEYMHLLAGHPWASIVTAGACSALDPMRFSLSTLYYRPQRLWEDAGQALMHTRTRGVMLYADSSVSAQQVDRLVDRGVNVVGLQQAPALSGHEMPVVQPDTATPISQLLHGLVERGHRRVRVGVHTCEPDGAAMRHRLGEVLDETGLGPLDEVLLPLPNPPGVPLSETYRPMAELLQTDAPPTAIVVTDEFAAADLFQSCYRLGVRVPDDLSVASRLDLTPHAYPVPLTAPDSVRVLGRSAEVAVEQLTGMIGGDKATRRLTLLPNDVMWRGSVADLTTPAPPIRIRRVSGSAIALPHRPV